MAMFSKVICCKSSKKDKVLPIECKCDTINYLPRRVPTGKTKTFMCSHCSLKITDTDKCLRCSKFFYNMNNNTYLCNNCNHYETKECTCGKVFVVYDSDVKCSDCITTYCKYCDTHVKGKFFENDGCTKCHLIMETIDNRNDSKEVKFNPDKLLYITYAVNAGYHDGYCSGHEDPDDATYISYYIAMTFPMLANFEDSDIDESNEIDISNKYLRYYQLQPGRCENKEGSGYCAVKSTYDIRRVQVIDKGKADKKSNPCGLTWFFA